MNNTNRNMKAVFKEIQEISFAMDELRLYLDVHSDNTEALKLFDDYMKKRAELVAEYTKECGPIYSYFINTEKGWSWINGPMPWEGGC